jgi:hypothetical protein
LKRALCNVVDVVKRNDDVKQCQVVAVMAVAVLVVAVLVACNAALLAAMSFSNLLAESSLMR